MKRGFAGLHPIVQITYYIGFMVLCMSIKHPLYLAVMLGAMIINLHAASAGMQVRENLPLYLISFFVLVILTPLTSHRGVNIIFYFLGNPITWEATVYGVVSAVATVTLLLSCTMLAISLEANGILFLLARQFPNITIMLLLALRLVPHFKIRLREISEVRMTQPTDENRFSRTMQMCTQLLASALDDAVYTAQSMRTRGYRLAKKRSFYFPCRWNMRNVILLSVFVLLILLIVFFFMQGCFTIGIYPELKFKMLSWFDTIPAVTLATFALAPTIFGGVLRGTN